MWFLNIVAEKENGTIEQINVTPVRKTDFILAKLIPYWSMDIFVISVCFLISWLVYGIVPQGNILIIYFLVMLLALIFSSLGLIVSNYSDTMQQAMLVMWFIMICILLMSGIFTPISSMPSWDRKTNYYYSHALFHRLYAYHFHTWWFLLEHTPQRYHPNWLCLCPRLLGYSKL